MDVGRLIERLREAHPDAACALRHENPFQLLVATILSAQCTDERVNKVTPVLFGRFPDAESMKAADPKEIEEIIRSTGFYHNKTKAIRGAAERIVSTYQGRVPARMEDLLTLPGVARKTANVVLGVGYRVADGIVVDTHVFRVSRRLGLTRAVTPIQVEQDLMKIVPRSEWTEFAHLLIFHGRRVCAARNPQCGICSVQDLCPSAPLFLSGKARETGKSRKLSKPRKPPKAGKTRKARKPRPTRKPKPARPPKRKAARASGRKKRRR